MSNKVFSIVGGMRQINKDEDILARGQIVVFKGYGEEIDYAVTGETTSTNQYELVALDGSRFSHAYAGNIHHPDRPHGIGHYWPLPGQPKQATEEQVNRAVAMARNKEAVDRARREKKFEEREEAKKAGQAVYELTRPEWAKAVIIARRKVNQSDPMTDYFGHTTDKTVVLCFSKHTRNNFREFRKAARLHPDTRHLADAPAEEVEHRENYSMGGGYYLGSHKHSGWEVYKATLSGYTLEDVYLCAGKYQGREYLPGQVLSVGHEPVKPERKNPQIATQVWKTEGLSLVCSLEVVENSDKDGIELHFDGKPNEAVLGILRTATQEDGKRAWRWHGKKKMWYAKDTERTRAQVEEIKKAI